ncbi:selenium-dependent molybdenum cofactor biosynthesis protein YqeB [Vallitalea sp.]|uniref:selenium-dependent molybdenum cofactor biosynthesis protein YqeB n=1 Tax=Vallitalea sp. TaxID=1882829 RepID=UPI002ED0A6B6
MNRGLVVVRGGGDIASGTIHRLTKCGFRVVVLEIDKPTVIRRTVSFANALFDNEITIENIKAVRADDVNDIKKYLNNNIIPILVDEYGKSIYQLKPDIVIDAILAKKNMGTNMEMAPIVIGLGPGFTAGKDVHAVIETNRGHDLGKVIYSGKPQKNTGIPGNIEGYTHERVIRSSHEGNVSATAKIGDTVNKGDCIGYVNEFPILAPIDGVIRGLIKSGLHVTENFKIGDVDPRGKIDYCFTISDKARAVAGGVLEAILTL